MSIIFRATGEFMARMRVDLTRAHPFAEERVGFISVKATRAKDQLILLAQHYHVVADNDYLYDESVGAMVGQEGFRRALEIALLQDVGIIHVHQHLFPGRLWFSRLDLREQLKFVPDFFNVRPNMPHGAIVLGPHAAAGRIWLDPHRIEHISEFNVAGEAINVTYPSRDGSIDFYA